MTDRLTFLTIGALVYFSGSLPLIAQTNWLAGLRSAREEHAVEVQGWLRLVGLKPLHPGDNGFGSAGDSQAQLPAPAPGHLMVLRLGADGRVVVLPPTGAREFPSGLTVDGHPAKAAANGTAIALHSSVIAYRSLSFGLVRSGSGYAMRVWDENSADLRSYHGLAWYPPDPRYRVRARFIPYPAPKEISIVNGDGTRIGLPSPGYAEFVLGGHTQRLQAVYTSPESKTLLFAFKDETAPHETYGAGRFLFTGQPEGGAIVLDFNLAENPACAYNPYTVCPLPPRENHLAVAVPASEKKYHD